MQYMTSSQSGESTIQSSLTNVGIGTRVRAIALSSITVAFALILTIGFVSSAHAELNYDDTKSKLEKGDTATAQTAIDNALKADAKDVNALFWSAMIDFKRGSYQSAHDKFAKAYEIKDNFYEALYHMAITQMYLGKFDQAESNIRIGFKKARTMRIEFKGAEDTLSCLKDYFRAHGGPPRPAGEKTETASTQMSGGNAATMSAPSLEDLKAKITGDPKNPFNYFALGKHYYEDGDYSKARETFAQGLEVDKNHDLNNYYYGLSLVEVDSLNKAEKLYENRLKDSDGFKAEYNNGLGYVFLARARKLKDRGESKEHIFEQASQADAHFRTAIALDSENALFHLNLAEANFIREVYPAAKLEYDQALAMSAGSTEILARYAEACFRMKDYECALTRIGDVIKGDSTNVSAWRMASRIYFGMAKAATTNEDAVNGYKNAIAAGRKYVELTGGEADSSDAQIYYELATALQTLGGHEEAIQDYKAVLAVPVEPRGIHLDLAKSLTATEQWDAALEQLQQHEEWVKKQGADYVSTISQSEIDRRYGEVYFGKKDYGMAAPYLVRAYKADTTQTKLLVNIALSYHNMDQFSKALPYYEDILSRDLGEQIWSLYLNGAFCALKIAEGGQSDMEDEDMENSLDPADPRAPSDYQRLAVSWLEQVVEFKPDNDRAISLLASTYLYQLNECANGVKWYQRYNEIAPNECEPLRSLGFAYFGGICTKDYAKAIGYLGRAMDCLGGAACKDTELALWLAQAHHLRAVDEENAKKKEEARADYKKAHEWYSKVLECNPSNQVAKEGKSAVEFNF